MVDNQAILKYVNDSEIPAQSDGLITKLSVDEGGVVQEGDTLVELDIRLAEAELKVAEKKFEAAKEKALNQSDIEYNKLSYDLAKKVSQIHLNLLNRQATSQTEYEKVKLEEEKARLAGVVAEMTLRTNELAAEVSDAEVGAARVQIDLRRIKAPFEGVIAERKKQVNDYVRVGEKIVRLVGMEKIVVIGRIPSKLDVPPHMLEKAPATAIITLFPATGSTPARQLKIQGNLSFVSPVQDTEGKFRVKMEISNVKDGPNWVLRDGMLATLEVGGTGNSGAPLGGAGNQGVPNNRR